MIYVMHHRDTDGAFAAAAAYKIFRDSAEYISVQYGEPFPIENLTKDDEVYILDFSYNRVWLDSVYSKVKKLVVLDHHKTAMEELSGAKYAIFNMEKCGSTLAWEYFFPNEPMHKLYHLVEDRDLFRYSFDETDLVVEGLRTFSVQNIPFLASKLEDMDGFLAEILAAGKPLLDAKQKQITTIVKRNNVFVEFHGKKAVIVNEPYLISDLSVEFFSKYQDLEVTICWFSIEDSIVFSLRSKKGSDVDVSMLAKIYGGGGHKHAAGFKVDFMPAACMIDMLLKNNRIEINN